GVRHRRLGWFRQLVSHGPRLFSQVTRKDQMLRAFLLMSFLALSGAASAQDDPQWPSLSYLRSDYRESVIVAHVRVTQAEVVARIPGYDDWRIVGEVVEPFKGKFRKGQTLTFYHGAEAGFKQELFLGDKIIFLHRNYQEKEKRWVY